MLRLRCLGPKLDHVSAGPEPTPRPAGRHFGGPVARADEDGPHLRRPQRASSVDTRDRDVRPAGRVSERTPEILRGSLHAALEGPCTRSKTLLSCSERPRLNPSTELSRISSVLLPQGPELRPDASFRGEDDLRRAGPFTSAGVDRSGLGPGLRPRCGCDLNDRVLPHA